MREQASNWLKQAEYDLDVAQANLEIKKYYVAAFYSQQCAEKALKALGMVKLRENFSGHNLVKLAKTLKLPSDILSALIDLNPDFIVSRYPDAANGIPAQMYDLKKSKRKVLFAEKVFKWVQSRIEK
ncbi:MAG: HEPN domain-containing protein [archaeon]